MKKIMFWITLIVGITVMFGSCSSSEDTTTTSSTAMPDYETTTLSGTMAGTAWTFYKGRVTVPTSSTGSYSVSMINDNLSDACSSTYTGTSSNPIVSFSRDNLTVGETELGFGTVVGLVSFYGGSTLYGVSTGKISIDTHTTTAVTGKMYAKFGSHSEINGTFTLSRCCLSSGSYSLCE